MTPPRDDGDAYPADLERDAVTVGGVPYHVRPIRRSDAEGLVAFHLQLSDRSTYMRFFRCHPTLTASEVEWFTQVDYHDRLALVAERDGGLIGVGRFDRVDGSSAEVAFVVADAYQHQGIATCLLDQLVVAARARGVATFTAEVLTENSAMLDVFCDSGLPVSVTYQDDVASVRFPLLPTDGYVEKLGRREASRQVPATAACP